MLKLKNCNKKNLWFLLNAKNKILGRLSTIISYLLIGKYNSNFKSNIINGGYVVVINSDNIIVTGNKFNDKIYYKHSGYIGGLKKIFYKNMFINNSKNIIRLSVKGMLPKNTLGSLMIKRLKIYNNNFHNHNSQKLILID